ncbi:hypothetical protein [Noviherbaspirillum suwonense]|jgi:hypothetical protein|uniref:Uncharacterized protein n=1 Tax=Noviherbaspirillum suwonense TaxID=1224511 RepID=A0ABY1QWE1_9BURK|nr:hypothetical protein [Noviherbaspirillum suwonense]SMP79625.1 hypothetical protein SAMN06295970_13214 [Noviherbaspirillum suwonense]
MALGQLERILVLAKTYPSPSAQYIETSCVAGISQDGSMRRLYPVPFRMIEQGQQFKKWQWIDVRVEKANKDHRPESHKLYIDTITCGDIIDAKKGWAFRWEWLDKIPAFHSFDSIESGRITDGLSIALLRPKRLIGLEIVKARNHDWTDEEKEKLMREQMQGDLFSEAEAKRQVKELRKVPFDFYYRYVCDTPEGEKEHRHKSVDWEAGALFWNCRQSYGVNWEAPFRDKLEKTLGGRDLMYLLGNQHRFQDQWLIISLVYPPKQELVEVVQISLFRRSRPECVRRASHCSRAQHWPPSNGGRS